MELELKKMTILQAAIDFFGLKDGQSRMDFARDEWKKLTDADKAEIKGRAGEERLRDRRRLICR